MKKTNKDVDTKVNWELEAKKLQIQLYVMENQWHIERSQNINYQKEMLEKEIAKPPKLNGRN